MYLNPSIQRRVILTGGLFLMIGMSQAQQMTEPQSNPIPTQVEGTDMNDALVDLGRSSHVNFMADATQFPTDTLPVSRNATKLLGQQLQDLNSKHKLTWLGQEQMVLIWSQPDLVQLAQGVIAGQSVKRVLPDATEAFTMAAPVIKGNTPPQKTTGRSVPTMAKKSARSDPFANERSDQEALTQEIYDYFREQHGWDKDAPGAVSEVKVSDLSPVLHDKVVAAVQKAVLRPQDQTLWESWFNDEFWKNARLHVMEENSGRPDGSKIPLLVVGSTIRIGNMHGGTMMSLGELKSKTDN